MPSSKEIWGPHVWGLFHSMADVSNRTDILFLWREVLNATMRSLPCAACRKHMSEYWQTHIFIPSNWNKMSSDAIRTHIRKSLHQFHNHVNKRLGKPLFILQDISSDQKRDECIATASNYFQQIQNDWKSVPIEWNRSVRLLLNLLASGPL